MRAGLGFTRASAGGPARPCGTLSGKGGEAGPMHSFGLIPIHQLLRIGTCKKDLPYPSFPPGSDFPRPSERRLQSLQHDLHGAGSETQKFCLPVTKFFMDANSHHGMYDSGRNPALCGFMAAKIPRVHRSPSAAIVKFACSANC